MKVKELRRIIKEEYANILVEAFADPNIRKMAKMRGLDGNKYSNFFKKFAQTHSIAWDKLPAGTLNKTTNMNDPMIKKGLAFWVNTSSKSNPYGANRYWDQDIPEGVMAVTLAGKIQYQSQTGVGSKGTSRYSDPVGAGKRGTLQLKKLKEIADEVYVMDMEMFRGGTKALKAKRADLKLGKDEFKDANAWRAANMKRYKDIMDARVGSRDQVDAMVGKIVKISNAAVAEGMGLVRTGQYGDLLTTVNGNDVPLNAVTSAMTRALRSYAEYIRYANDAEKDKEAEWGSNYNDRSAKDTAGYIKKILNAFETGNANDIGRY